MFKDLHEGVLEIFAEGQALGSAEYEFGDGWVGHVGDPVGRATWGDGGRAAQGFHIIHPDSPTRTLYKREHAARAAEQDIRRRILAGERPRFGKGRKPTRWLRIAKSMGIDLMAPAPAA